MGPGSGGGWITLAALRVDQFGRLLTSVQPRIGEMYFRKVILGKVPTLGCNPGISSHRMDGRQVDTTY